MHSKINKHERNTFFYLFDFLKFKFLIFGGSDVIITIMTIKVQVDIFYTLSIDYCVAHS